ncbi:hypothetical protein VINI7043_21311 [Vibrio nigripulchritudo ATCC 27043]|uniref:endonuclease/exonuclease/phosphatase family protein n=1 Tax=Vibrio nigripulchritudo TaxID=28173 RepID=UPI00021C1B38|nr:endonuclease/exonuclease/phosphatase family protein [Vibrio nigripulchritudo]EGU61708.1 hypothetical protein VINI7043_21311 [Vibrio nigripulchritudo ATCC 27043]
MKLATFNLYNYLEPGNYWYSKKDKNTNTEEKWRKKQQWITSQLSEIEADIIGFQEVFSSESLKQLCLTLGYEHFKSVALVGQDKDDPTLYNRPLVALASKHPIRSVTPVGTNSELAQALGISGGFSFSRTPVKAVIETEVFGLICVYVVHLKSKRALYSRRYTHQDSMQDKVLLEMLGQSQGKVASLLQRGTEAACLAADVMLDQRFSGLPTVVLGDINCDFRSVEYDALCPKGGLKVEGMKTDAQKAQVTDFYDKFRLHSAFASAKVNSKAPTHYYKGKGSTLDYIFVSNELEEKVEEHKVWNAHMVIPSTEEVIKNRDYKESTDHAIVTIELKP